jgi:hypothetical protein
MVAPLYCYMGQIGSRFGTWGVQMMPLLHGWGWFLPQTSPYVHVRHIQGVWGIGMLSQGHMVAPLYCYTGQVGPRFGTSGSLEKWKWCHNIRLVNLKRDIVVLAGAKTQTGQTVRGCGNLWISLLWMILCDNGQFPRVAQLILHQNDTWHLNATNSYCTQIRWGTSSPRQTSSSVKCSRKKTMSRFRFTSLTLSLRLIPTSDLFIYLC